MSILLIINGYAGAGKSTVARTFAEKNNFALISQDDFLFNLNAFDGHKELTPEDHTVAIKNMHDCVLNYMHLNRNIVVEGALVSISQKDPLDLRDFIKLGHTLNYQVKIVTLIADHQVCLERQKKRHYIIPTPIDKKLHQALSEIDQKIDNEIVIDTSKNSVANIVTQIERIV